jgi:hypothetical protein
VLRPPSPFARPEPAATTPEGPANGAAPGAQRPAPGTPAQPRPATAQAPSAPAAERPEAATAPPGTPARPAGSEARERPEPARPAAVAAVSAAALDAGRGPGASAKAPARPAPGAPEFSLVAPNEAEGFRRRLRAIKADFPDDPEAAVKQAGELLGEFTELVSRRLEPGQAGGDGGERTTEDLRVALQRYRAVFDRLLG